MPLASYRSNPLPISSATELAIKIAIEQKALDVRGFDVRTLTDMADFFVIASGTSERHVKGVAEHIFQALAKTGERPLSMSGFESSDWVLLDYGDLVIHLFYEPARQYYKLDELWQTAAPIPISEELEKAAKRLRTGMYRT